MQDTAIKTLQESLLKDIPMKSNGITVDVNKNRIQQDKNMRSLISVTLDTHTKLKTHVSEEKSKFKKLERAGLAISAVFAVVIIGIVANWTLAMILTFFGSIIKGFSLFIGKT